MGYFPKGGINTERKRSNKGGSEFVHFGKLSHIWPKSRKQEKKDHFGHKKINFKGNSYL